MRKTKIGVMDFHGSVDITDPCYDKDVWCRMNNVKISEGEYACYVWRHNASRKVPLQSIFQSCVTCAVTSKLLAPQTGQRYLWFVILISS